MVGVIECQGNKTTSEYQVENPPPASKEEIGKDCSVYDEDNRKYRLFHRSPSL